MSKYFIDAEFLEGTQKKWYGKTPPTIDLISIGIVAEDICFIFNNFYLYK